MAWHKVATTTELKHGEMKPFYLEDEKILLVNLNNKYYAVEDKCSHEDAPLDGGELEGDEIICPLHGARFCLKTGEALTPPAYESIKTYPVKIEDNEIFVQLDDN